MYGVLADRQLVLDKAAGPYNFNLFMHQWPTRWRERQAQEAAERLDPPGPAGAAEFVTHEFPVERIAEPWPPSAAATW